MKLQHNKLWLAITLGLLGAPALGADITCTVTPAHSVITEGQTLQLQALCSGALKDIEWEMDGVSVTGVVPLTGHVADQPLYYTTPVGLGGLNKFAFTMRGTAANTETDTWKSSTAAAVVVKPSSAVLARAANGSNLEPTTPVDAGCGTAHNTFVPAMPSNGAKCDPTKGTPALWVSGPTAFTWSCLSLNGGAEANCSATRGYTVTATAGANGSVSPTSQGVAAGSATTVTASPAAGYSATMSGCGGTQSGNTFTTGPVNANCTVTATFTNSPVPGVCGTANATTTVSQPGANLCTVGSAKDMSPTTAAYAWKCEGTNGGATVSCSAPRAYTVTASAGANGSISPANKDVVGNTTTTFTVTPASGYAASVSGCGGSLSGSTYTTGAITAACTVNATFAEQTVSTSDPGLGQGLWVPPGMPNRTVADQSGGTLDRVSYVPGCLNGGMPPSTSNSGCAANTSFNGTLSGTATPHTVTFGGDNKGTAGSGKQLVLRYKTPATVANAKYIRLYGATGGNVEANVRVWLSASATATYDSVPTHCKTQSTTMPTINTASQESITTTTTVWGKTTTTTNYYCKLEPNTVYYFGMEYDETGARRFQLDESSADFL